MKIWECKRALGLLKQIYRENLCSVILLLIVITASAVLNVIPSFLIGKIIDIATAGSTDGLVMLNVGVILALGGLKPWKSRRNTSLQNRLFRLQTA